MRRTIFLAAVSAAALSLAGGVSAQEPLSLGAELQAELSDADATLGEAYRYDDYAITLSAGQRIEAVMRSDAFDAYLEVYAQGQTEGEALAGDDDGLGEGTHSRLRFTAPDAGDYVLRARTLSGLEGGAYGLSLVERAPAPPAPRPGAIAVGRTVQGELADGDPERDEGGRYDAYAFRARSGDRLLVTLDSEAFDPVVRVGRTQGGVFTELAMDDDGAGVGLNSRLLFVAPEGGEYHIRVAGLAEDSAGAYALGLAEGPPPAPRTRIDVGDSVEGELSADDGVSESGAAADVYAFRGRQGQRIVATLRSENFDTYLELFRETPGGRESLAEDDDGLGDGTHSRLTHVLPEDGTYLLEARAFGEGTGAYALDLAEVAPPPPPQSLDFGATVQGEIVDDDARDDAGKPYDAYGFSGAEDQRVQIIVRSGDFDTYVEIGRAGDEWTVLASDDDGLGEGLDSRLNFTLPETGDYVIRATPLGTDGRGLYSVQLNDRGPAPLPGSVLVGATARGSLTEADAITDEGGYFDAYVLHGKSGEKLRLTMVSNAVDSLVEVGRLGEDGAFESLALDDDSLSDTHARLDWTVPDDGVYEVRARSYAPGAVGDYALTVERQP